MNKGIPYISLIFLSILWKLHGVLWLAVAAYAGGVAFVKYEFFYPENNSWKDTHKWIASPGSISAF